MPANAVISNEFGTSMVQLIAWEGTELALKLEVCEIVQLAAAS